jgi:hypothetical protein
MQNSIKRDPALRGDPKVQDYVKKVIENTRRYRNIGHDEDQDKHVIGDSNSFRMDSHLEYQTSITVVKRGGSSQPQAVGSQKKSKVGSNITPSPQEQKHFFDPNTETGEPNVPRYAASSSSAGSRKRPARRGHGPPKAKAEAQTTQTDRTNESTTTRTTGRGIRPHNVSQGPCYLGGTSGKDRPQVNKTMANEAVRLGNRHGKEDGLGAPTPRPKEHTHHVHHRDVTTHHLRRGGITATMRRSESFVRTPGPAPGKHGALLRTLRARPVVATDLFHH